MLLGSLGVLADESVNIQRLPGESACGSLAGWKAEDEFPIRSPLEVYDFLSRVVAGKIFVEIGTRNGDGVSCMAHFAQKVIAIEQNTEYCLRLKERSRNGRPFRIHCKTLNKGDTDLPTADVYYWWMQAHMNTFILEAIHETLKQRGKHAHVYFAIDPSMINDSPTTEPMLKRLKGPEFGHSGNVSRVFFDETNAGPTIFEKNKLYGRTGKWGMLVVLSATVGAGLQ